MYINSSDLWSSNYRDICNLVKTESIELRRHVSISFKKRAIPACYFMHSDSKFWNLIKTEILDTRYQLDARFDATSAFLLKAIIPACIYIERLEILKFYLLWNFRLYLASYIVEELLLISKQQISNFLKRVSIFFKFDPQRKKNCIFKKQ
jgi:thiamine kinase-like enzyme